MRSPEVVVIGLGAMGSATLYQLAKAGVHALGIDQFQPPHNRGSSHGETRITRLALGEGEAYVPLVKRSHEIWRELESATGSSLLHQVGGLIFAGSNGRKAAHGAEDFLKTTCEVAAKHQIQHERLTTDEMSERFPQFKFHSGESGYYEPEAGYIRPEACIQAQLDQARILGAGIRKDMDVPEGSKVETNPETGEPSGILRGWSRLLSIPSIGKSPTDKDRQTRLIELVRDYNANGITGIVDRNASDGAVKIYKRIQEDNQLSVRVALSGSVSNQLDPEGLVDRIQTIAKEPLHTNRDPFLRTIGAKIFLDGGMLKGSAFLLEPWGTSDIYGIDDPHYHGIRFISDESLRAAIKAAVQGGLQFTAHSVGDGAVHALIEAYAFVNQTNPIQSTRPNITHCNFMSQEAIDRMAALGISADIQPVWLYLDSRTLSKQFPCHRMEYFQPLRPMFEAGVLRVEAAITCKRSVGFDPSILTIHSWVCGRPSHARRSITRAGCMPNTDSPACRPSGPTP
jgi:hypothetical protein